MKNTDLKKKLKTEMFSKYFYKNIIFEYNSPFIVMNSAT